MKSTAAELVEPQYKIKLEPSGVDHTTGNRSQGPSVSAGEGSARMNIETWVRVCGHKPDQVHAFRLWVKKRKLKVMMRREWAEAFTQFLVREVK